MQRTQHTRAARRWIDLLALIALPAFLLALIALGTVDRTITVTWQYPTKYTNGADLAIAEIAGAVVQYGTCTTATTATFDRMKAEKEVVAPAAQAVFLDVPIGTYCVRVRVKDVKGVLSEWATAPVKKTVP